MPGAFTGSNIILQAYINKCMGIYILLRKLNNTPDIIDPEH